MIIVEGSDRIGKTSLVKVLCERLSKTGFPMVPQHFGLLPANWDYFGHYLPYVNRRTVMDRFILSELVYGTALRKRCGITPENYELLNRYLKLDRSLTVLVTADEAWYDAWLNGIELSPDEFNREQLKLVNDNFIYVREHNRFNEYEELYDISHHVTSNRTFPSSDEALIDEIVNVYLAMQEGSIFDGTTKTAEKDKDAV